MRVRRLAREILWPLAVCVLWFVAGGIMCPFGCGGDCRDTGCETGKTCQQTLSYMPVAYGGGYIEGWQCKPVK